MNLALHILNKELLNTSAVTHTYTCNLFTKPRYQIQTHSRTRTREAHTLVKRNYILV